MTERHEQHAVYVISVFAELAGVHPQTLRNYERSGLLTPQRTRGGSRRFSDEDLAALRRIQQLESELAQLRDQLGEALSEARHDVEQTHRQYRRDLVPVRNSIAVFIDAQRRQRGL
jgi:MerR family transcriptional regulator/heat shock protein HspR